MKMLSLLFVLLASWPAAAQTYDDVIRDLAASRVDVTTDPAAHHRRLVGAFDTLTIHWLGTTWGLGVPQTQTPGEGKINCGTFVGTILRDLGFSVPVKKLQRQPAELIIKSLTAKQEILRFRNRPVQEFVSEVAVAGDGVYIIGLDFHVGFLRVEAGAVRFIHASYVTGTVVNELAATSEPIMSSRYRVVGKIFGEEMLKAWALGNAIEILGHW